LSDYGIKYGTRSEIAVIHYSVYSGMSPQEKMHKLRQIYTKLGKIHGLDGAQIFSEEYGEVNVYNEDEEEYNYTSNQNLNHFDSSRNSSGGAQKY